jgi:hypothetical protein
MNRNAEEERSSHFWPVLQKNSAAEEKSTKIDTDTF